MALLLLLFALAQAWAGVLTVEVLDVGQGDSILLRSPAGKTVLIDAGTGSPDVVPMLQRRDVMQIDLAVATHPHADHIGGMDEVLEAVPVKMYMDSGLPHTTTVYDKVMKLVEDEGVGYRTAQAGQTFKLDDGIVINVLFPKGSPIRNTRSDLNANSVVLRVTHGDDCFLFVGDSEAETERTVMQGGLEPCEVLKVAHHGSGYSTSSAWLRAVKPKIALISVGAGNRYHHPDPDTVARLESAGAKVYRTDQGGTIRMESSGHGVVVTQAPEDVASPQPAALTSPPQALGRSPGLSRGPAGGAPRFPEDPRQGQPAPAAAAPPMDAVLLDINGATAVQLDQLPGIGPARAAAILSWRAQNGPFRGADDLLQVPGIGPATLEKLRPLVSCGPATADAKDSGDPNDLN